MEEPKWRLHVRAPVFGEKDYIIPRMHNFYRWVANNVVSIANDFKMEINSDYRVVSPQTAIELSGEAAFSYPASLDSKVPKGLVTRIEILALLDKIDSIDITLRKNSFFVHIDGSGAIKFDGIKLVLSQFNLKEVEDDRRPDIVLGKRPTDHPTWFMNHPNRKKIELFEKYFLEQKYAYVIDECVLNNPVQGELPDAQAGCWGICFSALKSLSLTARQYEIEYDLISSALGSGLRIAFTDDLDEDGRMGGGAYTGSEDGDLDYAALVKKFDFILYKLGYSKNDLWDMYIKYQHTFQNVRERELPPKYMRELKIYTET